MSSKCGHKISVGLQAVSDFLILCRVLLEYVNKFSRIVYEQFEIHENVLESRLAPCREMDLQTVIRAERYEGANRRIFSILRCNAPKTKQDVNVYLFCSQS